MPFRSTVVIDRWECGCLAERGSRGGWLLVYGRRKTGKTWLLRRCYPWSIYATVTRSGECIWEERGREPGFIGLDECVKRTITLLRRSGGGVVVDEFQRMPVKYWDLLAQVSPESERGFVACGSSMGVVGRVFDKRSPLLGLFEAFHVDIASMPDTVTSLRRHGLPGVEAVLWAVVVRDPWVLRHLSPEGTPWLLLSRHAASLVPVSRGLVGEVFLEEERQLTRIYDSVLEYLAMGYWRAADIAARLYSAGLSSSAHPGIATGILGVLEQVGLVEKIPLWGTRRAKVYYKHRSALLSLLYRVASIVEETGREPDPQVILAGYGVELQFAIGELLAEHYGLRRAYSIRGTRDIDVVLLAKNNRPQWGYEVKIGHIRRGEAASIAEWIRSQGIPRVGIVALKGGEKTPGVDELLDAEKIVELAEQLAAKKKEECITGRAV